jgi:thymidine kinase
MAKLYFRYGTVGSAKTLNLLAVAHSYSQQEKRVIVMKPALDDRFGYGVVKSRAGLEREADILLEPTTLLNQGEFQGVSCVLVDEAQFLSRTVIDQLRALASEIDVPVICYGLRSDFRTELFEGARRLFELADEITEIKTTCFFCNRRALFNLKLVNGKPTVYGPSIELGAEEKYLPACAGCYTEKLRDTAPERITQPSLLKHCPAC